ncbi:hypothetical protein UFOVP97_54 [uncultured Caudovirales phage]|uniref:Portal protein n=1 Tax=uncultured Caudovirales phage TaxID=2100421 RepID=A0A6J5LHG3_9CAUD|nr:hypothetical protein UFOVP97_54 [uncultured Caudovirales phage]CAB4134098.1 hypothetical protein UFOVP268_16 [uncultured Caudovirales phage]
MLFPGNKEGGVYHFDPNMGHNIVSYMENVYLQGITYNQAFWLQAAMDTRFYTGDQSVFNTYIAGSAFNMRREFNFNRIKRIISMIEGYQRRNRKSTIVIPMENGDEETADQYTKLMMHINSKGNILETISEAFLGSLITGLNLLQVWVDYRSDPINGEIKVDKRAYNEFFIDPYFVKHDLSDCNYIWIRSYLTKQEIKTLIPGKDAVIDALTIDAGGYRDIKFTFTPQAANPNSMNLFSYDEFYYRTYRKQTLLVDTNTGETTEWHGTDEDLRVFLMMAPELTTVVGTIPTVNLAIICQNQLLYEGPNSMGIDSYPFVPVFAYHVPEIPTYSDRISGVVRALRDPQYLYTRRRIIELDILESQLNSGWIVKENSVININDLFKKGEGQYVVLKQDAQMTDIIPIQPSTIPPGMLQVGDKLGDEISQISGVNEEMLGSALDDKAAVLGMLRQGAGLTTLQKLFDNLDQAQKMLGELILEYIQNSWTPGKVARILNEQPTPQFYNKKFAIYNCAIEEGLNTTSQKQMQLAQMLQLKEMGIPISDEDMLEATTFQGKKKIIDNMNRQKMEAQQQQQQQMMMQQQQSEMNMREIQSRIALQEASATAAEGLGIERMSRVSENQAMVEERRAKAEHDRDTGILDLVRAAKEIENIDIDQARQVFDLINIVKSYQEQNTQVQDPTSLAKQLQSIFSHKQPETMPSSGQQNNNPFQ